VVFEEGQLHRTLADVGEEEEILTFDTFNTNIAPSTDNRQQQVIDQTVDQIYQTIN
jgi:hypothetical protein